MKVTEIPIVVGALGTVPNCMERDWKSWKSEDEPNYRITKIGQNTETNLGDLKRLVVTQPPVKDLQLTLVSTTGIIIIIKE